MVHSGYGVHEADGGASTPGNFVGSPTSASVQAQTEAQRLRLQVGSPMSQGNLSQSQGGSQQTQHNQYPSVGSMLSPPAGSAGQSALATPNAKTTPANSPANYGVPSNGPPMPVLYEDPLLASKLLEVAAAQAAAPMSPNSAAIPPKQNGSLSLPHGDERALPVAGEVLSPSEHPTQTPACSPNAGY